MNAAEPCCRGSQITYWITTVLVALGMGVGGVADFLLLEPVVDGMKKLGYPAYFCVILGIWKVLGAGTILAPGTPRLKEWAYAGIIFDLTGAAASHAAVGDGPDKLAAPVILTVLALTSWWLRPPSRRLASNPGSLLPVVDAPSK